jgi:phage/plasmid-like protein (TIGR03299 family)
MPTLDTYVGPDLMHHGRTPAFRTLGTIFEDGTTVEDGLDQAYLSGWNVRTEPLTVITNDGMFPMPRHKVIMRDHPVTGTPEPIAPSGKQFQPVQPEELGEFAKALLDESDLILDSAGSVDNGRRVFLVLRSPESITYGAGDKVHPYLLAATGMDGSLSTIVRPLFMRLACTNQLTGVLYGKGMAEYRLRHTSTLEGRIAQAREALGLRFKAQDALDKEIERLLSVKVSNQTWGNVVDTLAPLDEDLSTAGTTRREKVRDSLWSLWSANTQKPIAGTAWAGVNAIGEYFDWYGPGADNTAKRAASQMFGSREATKARATRKALAVMDA